MVVTEIVGNIADLTSAQLATRHVERIRLAAADLARPVQRVVGDHGTEIGLRLPRGSVLRDGDILLADGHRLVVVAQQATTVLVAAPVDMRQMGITAHALGNRHLPAQFEDTEDGAVGAGAVMIVPDDHTVVAYLTSAGVPFRREDRVLPEPFRHAEHTH